MNELATKIQKADKLDANATNQILSKWTPLFILSQPKIHTPIKVDSIKNAAKASIARGAPKISPIKRAYSDQFIPN